MIAGTQYTFLIQSRDFYSNNKKDKLIAALNSKSWSVKYSHTDTDLIVNKDSTYTSFEQDDPRE
jgi:hypothetical protein